MYCYEFQQPLYFIFSEGVPPLLYYSHIPSAILALLIGFLIFSKNKKGLLNRLLFGITIVFTIWTVADLIAWTNINSDVVIFVWSMFGILAVALSILTIYFSYVFVEKRDIPFRQKVFFAVLFLPALLFAPTAFNLSGFNLEACDTSGYEHIAYTIYYSASGVLAMLWAAVIFVKGYIRSKKEFRKEIAFMGLGIEFFLITFFTTSFLASYLNDQGLVTDYSIEQYGFLGMAIFMTFIGVLIVRFKTFNVGVFASQAIVLALVVLIGAQFTFITSPTYKIVIAITLIFTGILGLMLIRSVKREIKQKERLQQLTEQLEKANLSLATTNTKLKGLDKLKTEFLSLASHQLRSPLTAIKGYASMLDEGAFGKLSEEQIGAARRIYSSAQGLVNLVEDLLNVSKIEQGGMQYEFMPTDLSKLVSDLGEEVRIPVENKKLSLKMSVPQNDRFMVSADPMKIRQVFLNLVDNSIKYTQEGSITIGLKRDHESNVVFYVQDTGVGVTEETKQKLFDKFSRGEAGKLNTGGSGLGLYLAQEIAKAHKGNVDVVSEGVGKGSLFTVTLPAVSSQKNGSYITT